MQFLYDLGYRNISVSAGDKEGHSSSNDSVTKNNEVIAEKPFPNSGVTRRLWTLGRLSTCDYMHIFNFRGHVTTFRHLSGSYISQMPDHRLSRPTAH